MRELAIVGREDRARFEILPLGGVEEQAERLPRGVHLTVTCSPVHGPDRAVALAAALARIGHELTVHVAARMVRDRGHLDALLDAMTEAGADDLFLIGGDVKSPLGEYSSALELLPLLAEHPRRPRTIGVAGYPEGHPFIDDDALGEALRRKGELADYVTTQMCFDPGALREWIERQRERGVSLPVLIGMPGKVARRQLLKMSARIGVGPSIAFLRKQRGLRSFLSRRSSADRLYDALAPMLDEPRLAVAGFQYFTFNQLLDTWNWHQRKLEASRARAGAEVTRGSYLNRGESAA